MEVNMAKNKDWSEKFEDKFSEFKTGTQNEYISYDTFEEMKQFIAELLKEKREKEIQKALKHITKTMNEVEAQALDVYRGKLVKKISKWTGGGSQADGYDQAIDEVLTLIK